MTNEFKSKKEMLNAEEKPEEPKQQESKFEVMPVYNLSEMHTKELNDLDDVEISSPVDGQILEYEAASSKWKNVTPV